MIPALAVTGLLLTAVPVVCHRTARRVAPGVWARAVAVCLASGVGLWESALLVAGLPGVLRAAHAGGLAGACAHLASLRGGSGPLALVALVLPVWAVIRSVRVRRVRRSTAEAAWVEPWLGEHRPRSGYEMVVVPSAAMVAVSVPGSPGQVVVSAGLLGRLTPDEADAVERHEAAHLALGHHRYLALAAWARAAAGYLPWLRSSVTVLSVALERWADETAAATPALRAAVRSALVAVVGTDVPEGLAAFAVPSTVVERLAALDDPPPRPSWRTSTVLAVPVAVVAAGMAAAVAAGPADLRVIAWFAGLCG